MRLITGDECGLLKECIPELSRKVKNPDAAATPYNAMPDVTKDGVRRIDPREQQTRERGIIDMAWSCHNEQHDDQGNSCEDFSFAALRKNGSVELWKASAESRNKHANYVVVNQTSQNVFGHDVEGERPNPLGLGVFSSHQKRICVGDSLGNVVVLKHDNNEPLTVVHTHNAYKTSKRGNTISYTKGQAINTQLATAIAFDTVHGRVAVGGRERETCLVDMETGEQVFKTKNLPPDPQTLLQQPVWPTAIQFLHSDHNTMAVGTAYKQVRLYDVRESSKMRRPTQTTPEGLLEYRVTSLCQVGDYELVVADGAGYMYSLDLRRLGRNLKAAANKDMGRYLGPVGSVRQLKKHPTLPRLAAVGLDRMLRIYDTKKRAQLDCIYLKQRINCVLMHWDDTWEDDNAVNIVDPDDGDIDQDDVVQEYVDSDEEQSDESDDDDGKKIDGNDSDSLQVSDEHKSASNSDDDDDDDDGHDDGNGLDNDDLVLPLSINNDEGSNKESENRSDYDEDDDDDGDTSASSSSPDEDSNVSKSDSEEDDDEVIVVKAPKRRRHR